MADYPKVRSIDLSRKSHHPTWLHVGIQSLPKGSLHRPIGTNGDY